MPRLPRVRNNVLQCRRGEASECARVHNGKMCCAQWMRVRAGSVLSIYIYNGARVHARANDTRDDARCARICMDAHFAQRGCRTMRKILYWCNFQFPSRLPVRACVRACNCVFARVRVRVRGVNPHECERYLLIKPTACGECMRACVHTCIKQFAYLLRDRTGADELPSISNN